MITSTAGAQGIALAGADDAPGYAIGSQKYKYTSSFVMTGPSPMNSSGEFQLNVDIASVRADVLAATYTLVTPAAPEMNGLQAIARINANGKLITYDMVNPKDKDAPMYVEAYRYFLPPLPPSYGAGTEWTVPFQSEMTDRIDQFSSYTTTTTKNTVYRVAGDTTVGTTKAVKVTFEMTGTARTVWRSAFDAPTTDISTEKGSGFHLFSPNGVYIGSRTNTESVSGKGKDQMKTTSSAAIDILR